MTLLSDFDFHLPDCLIAKEPLPVREQSRLLVVGKKDCIDREFRNVDAFLRSGDVLVLNNTRVQKARLQAQRKTGGKVEVLVERVLDEHRARCLTRSSRNLNANETLTCRGHALQIQSRDGEFFEVQFALPVADMLALHGTVPLPPYIRRTPTAEDERRYQTVYAKHAGAVAAPTAGLHFTPELLELISAKGVAIAEVTLHVGAGTFLPIRSENIDDHQMHAERYWVPPQVVPLLSDPDRRVVAVGTTVVRTLESWAINGTVQGETDLYIRPGFNFRVVDALITNFHLPESSLIVMLSAFLGRERLLSAYRHAINERYRFYSYGDAMFCERASV